MPSDVPGRPGDRLRDRCGARVSQDRQVGTGRPRVSDAYALAREREASVGGDTEAALNRLASIPISLHCGQGDDVAGFEESGETLGGGIAATGNYPGKATTADE